METTELTEPSHIESTAALPQPSFPTQQREAHVSSQAQNPTSPYYLHPSETPSLVLVQPPLVVGNYYSWARAMRMALFSKNKVTFIDGTIPIPDSRSELYGAWQRVHSMVTSWIINSTESSIHQSLLCYDNATDVWTNLKVRFSQKQHFRISDLQREMHSIQQGDLSVTDFFTKLKIMWDEYRMLRPLPSCSCVHGCNCEAVRRYKIDQDHDHILCFLKGLNVAFGIVKSNIMMMDPLPSVEAVFGMVVQQEQQLSDGVMHTSLEATAFASRIHQQQRLPADSGHILAGPSKFGNSKPYNSNNRRPRCSYCGNLGHTIQECYHKHGFPPGYKARGRTSQGNQGHGEVQGRVAAALTSVEPVQLEKIQSQYQQILSILQSTNLKPTGSTTSTPPLANMAATSNSLIPDFNNPNHLSGCEEQGDDWFC